jgi:hypothetical protein
MPTRNYDPSPAKLSFRNDGVIKTFSEKHTRDFVITRPVSQEMLKRVLQAERNGCQ